MRFVNFLLFLATFMLGLNFAPPALAHGFRVGSIYVDHPVAPASLPGQTSAAVYFAIENQGATADRLIALQSPAAQNVVVHQMTMNGPVMAMREVENLPIASMKRTALLANSGYHVMMTGLKQPLRANDKISLTLTFERAGKVDVTVEVEPNAAQKAAGEKMKSGPD